jgi:A/G-specific adenine glycosylase
VETADELLDEENPGDFNQAMMELGATICKPAAPSCERCPVSSFCIAFAEHRQAQLPVRAPRKPVPHYHIAIGVVEKDRRVLITRRKDSGLLGGLWEFPGGKVRSGEAAADACKREIREEVNLEVEVTDYLTRVEHAYTHFKIGVDVYSCAYKAGDLKLHGPVDFRWVLVDELYDYAFPGANHKFLALVKKRLKAR